MGVKNMMNFRVGYRDVTNVETHAFVLDLPGPTPPTPEALPFVRLARPTWFPPRNGAAESVSEPTVVLFPGS